MTDPNLESIVQYIAVEADSLRRKHLPNFAARISWCCIFCQSEEEFGALVGQAQELGQIAKQTHNGPVFATRGIATDVGTVRVVKVRKPDLSRPERGDADFAVEDYESFRGFSAGRPGFKSIERDDFNMVELMEQGASVRVYFSNPPVETHEGIRQALERQG